MKKSIFWGIFLLLAGAYLVVSQLGYLPAVNLFTIVCTIACLAVFVASIPHLNFAGILFPIAFVGILYDEQLGITAITPWTILLAALLGSIGLHLVFGRFRKKHCCHGHGKHGHKGHSDKWNGEQSVDSIDGENVWIKERFGSTIRYLTSDNLSSVEIDVSFGAVEVYFDHAKVPSGNVDVYLNSSFAGVELYVPREWQVLNEIDSSFGAVEAENVRNDVVTTTLTLKGTNSFGGVEVNYV